MFLQVIEGKVADATGFAESLDEWMKVLSPGAAGWLGTTSGTYGDGSLIALVRFESAEAAKTNSDRPEQGEWWSKASGYLDGDVSFDDFDDVTVMGSGGSDDAGFVQIMRGRVADVEKERAMAQQMSSMPNDFRPDIIGGVQGLKSDGSFVMAMYFTSEAGGAHHVWRQRFPDGRPEQVTSGPTEEEGFAMAPDGRSFVTAVTLSNVAVWVHDASGDRPISLEGNSADPEFTPDGSRLLYRIVKQTPNEFRFMGGEPGEVWVTELKSGRSEPLAPGFQSLDYDISADGRQVVIETADPEGKPQLWVVGFDRQSPPRQIPNVTGRTPRFGPSGEIFFRTSGYAYRVRPDGTGLRKAIEQPVALLVDVSPDGRLLVAWSPIPSGGNCGSGFSAGRGTIGPYRRWVRRMAFLSRWPLYLCLGGAGWRRPQLYRSVAAATGLAKNSGARITVRAGFGKPPRSAQD